MKMQSIGTCSCAAVSSFPAWFIYLSYALTALLVLLGALIAWKLITTRWPLRSAVQLLAGYGLTAAIPIVAKQSQLAQTFVRPLWFSALLIVALYAPAAAAAWLYRGWTQFGSRSNRDKFESLVFFLPRDVRESFWAGWKEDRRKLINAGHGRAFRRRVFIVAIGWEVATFFKDELRELVVDVIVGVIKPKL